MVPKGCAMIRFDDEKKIEEIDHLGNKTHKKNGK